MVVMAVVVLELVESRLCWPQCSTITRSHRDSMGSFWYVASLIVTMAPCAALDTAFASIMDGPAGGSCCCACNQSWLSSVRVVEVSGSGCDAACLLMPLAYLSSAAAAARVHWTVEVAVVVVVLERGRGRQRSVALQAVMNGSGCNGLW
jgi:hypothetical protein